MFNGRTLEKGRKWMVLIGIALTILLIPSSAFAAVLVTNRTGTIVIIRPDATEVIVRADEELPDIPDGSTIVILFGSAEIRCTEGSYVEVIVGTSSAYLGDGDAVTASFSLDTFEGRIDWLSGRIDITYPGGSLTLDSGRPSFDTGIGEIETQVEVEEDPGDISPSR